MRTEPAPHAAPHLRIPKRSAPAGVTGSAHAPCGEELRVIGDVRSVALRMVKAELAPFGLDGALRPDTMQGIS